MSALPSASTALRSVCQLGGEGVANVRDIAEPLLAWRANRDVAKRGALVRGSCHEQSSVWTRDAPTEVDFALPSHKPGFGVLLQQEDPT